jgi:hypothetical protein
MTDGFRDVRENLRAYVAQNSEKLAERIEAAYGAMI